MTDSSAEASTDASDDKPMYPIASVDSALRLLLLIVEREQVRLSDASLELGVARSTTHRLLQMLLYHGFVRQDDATKLYRAGPVLFDLGLQLVRNLDVRAHARPALEWASSSVDETVQLFVVQHDGRLVCIDAVEGERSVRVGGRVGLVLSPAESASGLAVLSQMAPEKRESILGEMPRPPAQRLDAQLDEVRSAGFAVWSGEGDPEVAVVSAPILDGRGHSAFAVSISVPKSRFDDERVKQLGKVATECAARIAADLPW